MKLSPVPRTFLLLAIILSLARVALAQPPPPSAANRADALVINTEVVSITVSVRDKEGRRVTGLDRSAFRVFEDGITQQIAFFSVDDAPASVGIVFDLSGSMSGEKIERAREALTRFIQTGHTEDEYSLITFSDRTQTLLDRAHEGEAMAQAVHNAAPRGNTALFDAMAVALEHIKRGRWNNRALIIISDGEDNRSRTTLRKLRQMILEAGVTVHAVIIEETRLPRFFGAEDLRALAADSGGRAFSPNTPARLEEAFDQIALEMRQRYSIGYAPANTVADGRWRRLEVKVTPPPGAPRPVVKTRMGYYAVPACHSLNEE